MRIVDALKRIARREGRQEEIVSPSVLVAEITEMIGASDTAAPVEPLLPPVAGEKALAIILARHGKIGYPRAN